MACPIRFMSYLCHNRIGHMSDTNMTALMACPCFLDGKFEVQVQAITFIPKKKKFKDTEGRGNAPFACTHL